MTKICLPNLLLWLQVLSRYQPTYAQGDSPSAKCWIYVRYPTFIRRGRGGGVIINNIGIHFEDPTNIIILEFQRFDGIVCDYEILELLYT